MTERAAAPEERRANQVSRTLSLLPAMVGLVGVAATVMACIFSGLIAGSQGTTFTLVAAALVGITVLTGGPYGMYLGLFILTVGTLVVGGEPTTAELLTLVTSLVVIHEVVRFSLDSRRPARFGPGVARNYASRATLVIVALIVMAWAASAFADRAPTNGIWMPAALVAAGLPLFVRPVLDKLDGQQGPDRPFGRQHDSAYLRAVLATGMVAGVLTVAVIGAQARNELGSAEAQTSPVPATTTTTAIDPATEDTPGEGRQLPSWLTVVLILLLAVMVYFISRRPEAIFQLEEVDQRDDDTSFDFAVSSTADADEQTIDIDEDTLATLLLNLQLDIQAERDPGRAIRFGYAKIEHRLGEFGLTRAGVETEREFLMRSLPRLGEAGPALTLLTRLFERARFSSEPIDESMRQQALRAIDQLAATVGVGGSR